jgi:hypothetical protein
VTIARDISSLSAVAVKLPLSATSQNTRIAVSRSIFDRISKQICPDFAVY